MHLVRKDDTLWVIRALGKVLVEDWSNRQEEFLVDGKFMLSRTNHEGDDVISQLP